MPRGGNFDGARTAADAPATTDASGADDRGADGRPHRPGLVDAPREVLLYSKGCGIYRAVEPWQDGQTYDVTGLERRTCAGAALSDQRIAVLVGVDDRRRCRQAGRLEAHPERYRRPRRSS